MHKANAPTTKNTDELDIAKTMAMHDILLSMMSNKFVFHVNR